jgi:hypothetical protein
MNIIVISGCLDIAYRALGVTCTHAWRGAPK